MSTIAEIENAVKKLSRQDLAAFRNWFAAFDAADEDAESKKQAWAQVDRFREQLAKSGRSFGDSTDLVREDRQR